MTSKANSPARQTPIATRRPLACPVPLQVCSVEVKIYNYLFHSKRTDPRSAFECINKLQYNILAICAVSLSPFRLSPFNKNGVSNRWFQPFSYYYFGTKPRAFNPSIWCRTVLTFTLENQTKDCLCLSPPLNW